MSWRARGLALGAVVVVVGAALWWSRSGEPEVIPGPAPQPTIAPQIAAPQPVAPSPEGEATGPQPTLAEVAGELAGDEGVVCRIEPQILGGTARLALDEPSDWLAIAAVRGDVLVLSEIPEAGSGTLRVEGFAPAAIRWSGARDGAGACAPDPLILEPAEAGVVGTVLGAVGASLGLTACGQPISLDSDGGFYAAAVPGEACLVQARRHYGVWEWADAVEVIPRAGDDVVVEIEAPGFEAVLPVVVAEGRLAAVWEGDQTLVGARILAVDGAVVPADPEGFHLATGGAEGSEAELELQLDGRSHRVTLIRRALTFEDWLVR